MSVKSSGSNAAEKLSESDLAANTLQDGEERRLDERIKISMPCTFVLGNGNIVGGITQDLSASGVAILSDEKPVKGSHIHLHFDGCGVHAGEISRIFPGGFAVVLSGSSLAVLALVEA